MINNSEELTVFDWVGLQKIIDTCLLCYVVYLVIIKESIPCSPYLLLKVTQQWYRICNKTTRSYQSNLENSFTKQIRKSRVK